MRTQRKTEKRAPSRGFRFIMFGGIDGSGKSTVVHAFVEELRRAGLRVFDLPTWSRNHGRLPLPRDCKDSEVILSAEPTSVWVGGAIRGELIREGTRYDGRTVAEAFSLDRLILYNRLLIPLLKAGKLVVQDRGVESSITYQPLHGVNLRIVTNLPGNALALETAPDLLVIASCHPELALRRLAGRRGKRDHTFFERRPVLKALHERYHAPWFRRFWQRRGTRLYYFNTEEALGRVEAHAATLAHLVLDLRAQQ